MPGKEVEPLEASVPERGKTTSTSTRYLAVEAVLSSAREFFTRWGSLAVGGGVATAGYALLREFKPDYSDTKALTVVALLGLAVAGFVSFHALRSERDDFDVSVSAGEYKIHKGVTFGIDHDRDERYLEFTLLDIYVVNRSPHNLNLWFTWRGTVDNFDKPCEQTSCVTNGDGINISNPAHVDKKTNRGGPLKLRVPFSGRNLLVNTALVANGGWLHVLDEQSGNEFEFAIPGRYDTRPRRVTTRPRSRRAARQVAGGRDR